MPRRGRRRLTLVAAAACGASLAAGCDAGNGGASAGNGCTLTQVVPQPGSPLTLQRHARLDRVGEHFVLGGADDDGTFVRWAAVDPVTGALGPEQAFAVPPHETGPWFAVAGQAAPGDAVLVAYSLSAPNDVDGQIVVQAIPFDGSAIQEPLAVVATIAGGAGGSPVVALGSSRLGMATALAWIDAGAVHAQVLDGRGQGVGPAVAAGTAVAATPCLAFVGGRRELTLGFYAAPDTTAAPAPSNSWRSLELHENGASEPPLSLAFPGAGAGASCPLQAGTTAGYALAWQDGQGSWLGTYDAATNRLSRGVFATAVTFGGADLQPPLAGLAPVGGGQELAVVVVRPASAELWRLGPGATRHPGALGFPSLQGAMGDVASLPVDGSLTATYADYAAGVGPPGGQRYLLRATCD